MEFSSSRTTLLAGWLVSLISLSILVDGAPSLPTKLHCSSTVFLYKSTLEEGPLLTLEQSLVEEYQVEEYLDLNLNRSSTLVFDVNKNEHAIYYNHMSPNRRVPERQLVVYDPIDRSCREIQIYKWLLTEMRATMIALRLDRLESEQKSLDVPIGPSGMLYMIESSLDQYLYSSTIFSVARLTTVGVFRKTTRYTTAAGSQLLTVIVHVLDRSQTELKPGDPLSKLYKSPGAVSADSTASVDIALVGVCRMGSADDDPAVERVSPASGVKDPKADLQLDGGSFCRRDRTLFVVHYNVVTDHSPGSLLGSSLAELSESRYDFHREPMMMPAGIGCWTDNEGLARWQKRLTLNNPMSQISGEYVTEFGARGVSFIAYDQQRGLVRLDRNGRKSVYDLLESKSYHVGEFKESHEVVASAMSQADKSKPIGDQLLERCVALDISTSSQIVFGKSATQQLLGLEANSGAEHYLGTRMIDHVNYEVFEKELAGDDATLPVVLQFAKFRTIASPQSERLFITYYAQTIAELSAQKSPLILSYVELWQFDGLRKTRRLLNRVHFTEFSWQLDVEPTNDPRNQHSDSLSVRLFDLEQCYQGRSMQAEILIDFKRDESVLANQQLRQDLHRNRHAIAENVQSTLAQWLEVSSLSVVGLKMRALENGDLLTSLKIVDLDVGLADNQLIGYDYFLDSDTFDKHLQRVFHNRHSLDECQLESVAWSRPNWVGFCQQLALCVILEQSDELKRRLKQGSRSKEDLAKDDTCYVYAFRYSSISPLRSAVYAAQVRSPFLQRYTLRFDLEDGRELGDQDKNPARPYVATPKLREFKNLDAIGARLTNEAASLEGLRYSTPREVPTARNLNSRVHVPRDSKLGTFRFCQLACQMDDICGSFSVCRRNQKPNEAGERGDDCVLSSMRLSGERVNELARSSMESRKQDRFEMRVTNEHYSQVLVMYREETCSLHSKDFAAEYEMTKTFIQLGDFKPYDGASKRRQPGDEALERRRLSLDDCAGLSFERNINVDPNGANFTYCPLDAHCIVLGDDHRRHMDEMNGYCFVYKRRLTRPYDVRHMMHLVLARKEAPNVEESGDRKGPKKELSAVAEATRMEEEKLVKKLWALDVQSCAQECNLGRSRCLAFDSCRQAGRVLCVLFSVRSPLAKPSAYLPQLKLETQTVREHNVTLLNSLICDHYHLKPDYLEVRLKHLLELEAAANSSSLNPLDPTPGLVEDNAEREKQVDEREQKIISEDEQKSKREASRLEAETAAQERQGAGDAVHANKWFHFGALLLGLLLGAVGSLYRQQIAQALATGYSWYQIRRAHNSDQTINRLVLDDPFAS